MPKLKQDGDRTEVGHQQVEKAGLANLGNAMLRGDQKVRRQRHRLPRQHECIGVIGEQNEAHAGEKQVVLQAQESRRRAFTPPEVARRKNRNASGCGAEQNQETRARVRRDADERASPAARSAIRAVRRGDQGSSAATTANAAPQSAPNGKSVRPTKAMLRGRTNPARPTMHHAVSSSRHSVKGELKP